MFPIKGAFIKIFLMAILVSFTIIAAAGCKEKGPAEKAGQKIDESLEKVGDKIEKAGDKVKDLLGK